MNIPGFPRLRSGMFGSHLSVAGSMAGALEEASRLKLDTVQVFTKNQQQWKVKPLDPGVVHDWRSALRERGWEGRPVSHASYLINLASGNDELWGKSIDLMQVEIERCEELSIPFLVHHPGSTTGAPASEGIARIAGAYAELGRRTKGLRTVCCLEDTVGSGSHLGRTFEELAALRGAILAGGFPEARVGFCLDTCHLHAGGYDLSTRAGAKAAFDEFASVCGEEHLKVLHLNDSKGPCASRLDRHAHIGAGTIGGGTTKKALAASGFAEVVNRPAFAHIPKILETPKEDNDKGVPMDTVNLKRLKSIMGA